ncbi:MAG TPA: molybdopterin-dependent oxidoreductase [Myxococcota bacterium]|nr:molybdopterin-dependent oxidoreductase [Myxococcota bacterium]
MISSYCRVCEGLCGVHAEVQDGRITALRGDPANPKSAGALCPVGENSAVPRERLATPLKRVGSGYQPVSWDEAVCAIASTLKGLRREHGPRSIGLYAGGPLANDHAGVLRLGAFAFAMGTPNVFTELAMYGASKLYATDLVMGAPMALQADVGRSHYTILIGGGQEEGNWGPMQAGTVHHQALSYFRGRRKGTKLVVVDSRKTALAEGADSFIQVRPGTEVFYMLGLASATLENRWIDKQYVSDYTRGFDQALEWLEPWTPARCAEICGIDVEVLAGVGLKFGRSAMGCVVASPTLTQSRHGTVASWAWLVHAAVTANLLRPGGLYETGGLVDLSAILGSFPTSGAPASSVRGFKALLAQLPGTALAEEILQSSTPVRALVCVDGCPLTELPDPERTGAAFEALELLVAIDSMPGATTARADWILPSTHFWERADLHLLDTSSLPSRYTQATPALLPPHGQARDVAAILGDLLEAAAPPLRGGEWGGHLRLLGRFLGGADLDAWIDQALDWSGLPDRATLEKMPSGLDAGETDRAGWRPADDDERLNLAPAPIGEIIRDLDPPPISDAYPLRLTTAITWAGGKGWRYRSADAVEPGIRVHPDLGLKGGASVVLETAHGSVSGRVVLDEDVHPIGVVVPWGWSVEVGEVVGTEDVDPLSGSPEMVGLPCRLKEH